MSNAGNVGFQKFVYSVEHIGNDMVVSNKIPQEDYLRSIIEEAGKQIHQLIYNFVSDLESNLESSPMDSESLYCYDVLSRDKKFMRVVQEIYEKPHKRFEHGYKRLINKK